MAKFNEAFEESLRADGASRQKSINSSTLRDVITNRSPDDYRTGGQTKINNALRFFETAGLLDMTVGELASDEGRVAFVNAMTGDAYAKLGKNQANEASKFISGIFEDAGHGKAWGSNTLKRELSAEKAKELFPIEATQLKVKGYPDDFFFCTKNTVMALQAAGEKEAAAQLLLSMIGGYRAEDLAGIKVEDIDFRTGVIFDITVKGAGEVVDKTGIFSAPQLDIIKDYLGDRTDGLLFENPKANSRIINAELEKQFPPDYLTKKSKARGTYTSKVTYYDFRHFNETYLSAMDVSTELRKVSTLRAASDVAEQYAASGARRADVNRLHSGMLALFSAGSGTASPAQFLNDALAVQIGVDDAGQPVYNQPVLSDRTKRVTPTRELIERVGYEEAVPGDIYQSLPEDGDVFGQRAVNVDPDTTAAINQRIKSEATEAALDADIRSGEKADEAAAGRAKALETRQDQDRQRKQDKLDTTKNFLLNNLNKFKTPLAATLTAIQAAPLGPVDLLLSGFTTDREKIDKAEEMGRQATADLFGIDREPGEFVARTRPLQGTLTTLGGGAATLLEGAGQVLTGQSLVADENLISDEPMEDRAARLLRSGQIGRPFPGRDRLNLPPAPEPTPQGMLEAGDAPSKVQEAEDRARSGQPTSMLDVQPLTI